MKKTSGRVLIGCPFCKIRPLYLRHFWGVYSGVLVFMMILIDDANVLHTLRGYLWIGLTG